MSSSRCGEFRSPPPLASLAGDTAASRGAKAHPTRVAAPEQGSKDTTDTAQRCCQLPRGGPTTYVRVDRAQCVRDAPGHVRHLAVAGRSEREPALRTQIAIIGAESGRESGRRRTE